MRSELNDLLASHLREDLKVLDHDENAGHAEENLAAIVDVVPIECTN